MPKKIKPVPEGYCTVTPALVVEGADKAMDFYKRAFGAVEAHECMRGPDGKVMHAELKIGNSIVMVSDAMPSFNCFATKSRFYLYVDDCDSFVARATKAGAKPEMPVSEMFWGDRCGAVADPWGNTWTVATHKEDLTPEQIKKRGQEWMTAAAR